MGEWVPERWGSSQFTSLKLAPSPSTCQLTLPMEKVSELINYNAYWLLIQISIKCEFRHLTQLPFFTEIDMSLSSTTSLPIYFDN